MVAVCPKCDVAMLLLHFKDVEVDFCERCRGIWLDEGELQILLETTGSDTRDPFLRLLEPSELSSMATQFLCPRCDAKLQEFSVKNLSLDRCPRGHGLWFDAFELRRLLSQFGASKTVAFLNDLFGNKPITPTEESTP